MHYHVRFIAPPVPSRDYDWEATDDNYDAGDPIGYGRTPVTALADLLLKIEENKERDDERWRAEHELADTDFR